MSFLDCCTIRPAVHSGVISLLNCIYIDVHCAIHPEECAVSVARLKSIHAVPSHGHDQHMTAPVIRCSMQSHRILINGHHLQRRLAIRGGRGRLVAMSVHNHMIHERLLDWADDNDGDLDSDVTSYNASGAYRPVHVTDVGGPAGRGLVALRDLEPGEILISVPFDRIFKSEINGGGLGEEGVAGLRGGRR